MADPDRLEVVKGTYSNSVDRFISIGNVATGRCASYVIAASDSSERSKQQADVVCSGVDDQEEIQAAIDDLTNGGKILILDGNYEKSNAAGIAISSNVEIELVEGATIKLADNIDANSFVFANSDQVNGNSNIIIKGGVLDGNCHNQAAGSYRAVSFKLVDNCEIDTKIIHYNHYEFSILECTRAKYANRHIPTEEKVLDACETLDNWTSSGGAMTLDNTIYISGLNSIKGLTDVGGNMYLSLSTPEKEFTRYNLGVWIYVDDISKLSVFSLIFWAGGDSYEFKLEWPAGLDLISESYKSGKWYRFIITPFGFGVGMPFERLDMITTIQFRIMAKAAQQVAVYIGKVDLVPVPQYPTITPMMDDGTVGEMAGLSVFEQYGYKGVIAIETGRVGDVGFLTLNQLRIFQDAGWDLCSHTITHPFLTDVSDNQQNYEILQSKVWLERHGFRGSNFFVTPSHDSDPTIEEKLERTYINRRYYHSVQPGNVSAIVYSMFGKCPQYSAGVDGIAFVDSTLFRESLALHIWYNMYSHGETTYFDALFQYCQNNGISVKTYSEIYNLEDIPKVTTSVGGTTDLLQDCLALSANHVVNAEALNAGSPITCSIASQPDVPRTLSWILTHAQITEFTLAIVGVDAKGNTITETVTEADGWSGELDNAFATVTSITFTRDAGTGVADTLNVGIADKLGLSNIIYATGDVFKVKENNADYTNFTVDATYHTVSIDGAIGAGDDYTIWYRTNLNIVG